MFILMGKSYFSYLDPSAHWNRCALGPWVERPAGWSRCCGMFPERAVVLGRNSNPEPCTALCPCHKQQAVAVSKGSMQTPCILHVVLRAGEQLGTCSWWALQPPWHPARVWGEALSRAWSPALCLCCLFFISCSPSHVWDMKSS